MGKELEKKLRLISKFTTSEPGKQAIKIIQIIYKTWETFFLKIIDKMLLLLEMMWNMSVAFVCLPGCDAINFEINVSFIFKRFSHMIKKISTKT